MAAMPLETIRTRHLVLAPLDERLIATLAAGDFSEVACGAGWPHEDTPAGLALAVEHGGWLVTLEGSVIGDCGLLGKTQDGEVEIGYGLAAPSRGKGFGLEMIEGLSRWLLDQHGIARVVAFTNVGNWASRRALAAAGFALDHADGQRARYVMTAGATGR